MRILKSHSVFLLVSLSITADANSIWKSKKPQVPTVQLRNGSYYGQYLPSFDQDTFLGVPYAQDPVGDLRFRPPVPLNETFRNIRPALNYSHVCPGYGGDEDGLVIGEDCLTINIVRPAGLHPGAKLPVAVWIHGGGYVMGASARDAYNLSWFVQTSVNISKPILGVSFNYRLSAFGFLNGREAFSSGNTNIGLRDQRLALHWLQENIDKFGGDPRKVTVWGESAGAESISNHLLAYRGRDDGLFRAAILESGSPTTQQYVGPTDSKYQLAYDTLVRNVSCADAPDSLACLRTIPFDTLYTAIGGLSARWNPVIDGDFLTAWPTSLYETNEFLKVPLLSGANTDEGTSFAYSPANTTEDIEAALTARYALTNSSIAHILELYSDPVGGPPFNSGIPANATLEFLGGPQFRRSAAIAGDIVMIGPRRLLCEVYTKAGVPVWSYRWNVPDWFTSIYVGATHFQEVIFVFSNPLLNINDVFAGPLPQYRTLSHLVTSMWVSFVHDLNPNNHGVSGTSHWPQYSETKNFVFELNTTSYVEMDDFRKEGIAFISQVASDHQLLN